jgi:glycosyltransferase involved in cell wall biosynthesis
MIKILFVNLEGRIGGAERSLLLLIECLQGHFAISVACPSGSQLAAKLDTMNIETHGVAGPVNRSSVSIYGFARLLKTCWRLINTILKVKPDIIHANSFYSAVPSMVAAIVTRKKLFIHARDLANFGFFTRVCGYFSTRIIAVSRCVKDTQVKNGASPGKITVVYNGGGNHFFTTKPESMDSSRHNRDTFVFANVGQFVPWKNQTLFLKAASVVGSRCAAARFVLVGDDFFDSERAYKQTLFDYAANSNVSDRIAFWGWRENMSEVWPKIDCLVHTADREPFGRVIIEAMAYRIPVIAMKSCGPKEIIDDRKTGILVDADDFEGLVQSMLTVARDRQFASRLAESGYEQTVSRFTADKTASRIKEVYREFLAV